MCIKNIISCAKTYKFLHTNIFGRLFVARKFRGKGILYARINRRCTLRRLRLNALKLRKKRPSLRGKGIYAALRFKKFYFSLSDLKIKRLVRKAKKVPHYKLYFFKRVDPIRMQDKLLASLEMRLENVLGRTGLLSPQMIRGWVSQRKVFVNGKVVTNSSTLLKAGDVVTFDKAIDFTRALFFRSKRLKLRKLRKKQKNTDYSRKTALLQPFIIINRLNYLSFSYSTLRILVGNAPKYSRDVYYPFSTDIKHLLLRYNNI